MKNPSYRTRTYLLTIVVLVGFGALLGRLYQMQIERQHEFRKLVPGSRTVTVREPGVRGEITDRNGVVLARNRRNYEVKFNLEEIYQAWKEQYAEEPTRELLATRDGMLRAKDEVDIAEIVNTMVVPRLKQIGDRHGVDLVRNYSSKALRTHFLTHRGLVPFTYRSDLDYDEFATLAEHNLDLPGVEVSLRPVRVYPFRAMASHILGYVKQWEKGDIPERAKREFDHYIGEDKGVAGVEVTMDEYLRGPEGIQRILKDEKGRVVAMVDYHRPEVGAKVELTIDARRQYLVESVLRRAGRAAAVVIDVNTGAVIAMGSVPDYDPNNFVPAITPEKFAAYGKNKCSPFTNRAITGLTPGSTFKVPTAIAAALHGQADRSFACTGYVPYGKHKIGCWLYNSYGGAHGTLALSEAIQRSCNPYFNRMANSLGSDAMVRGFQLVGLGQRSGIRLPSEDPGILPGSESWRTEYRPGAVLTPALGALLSIGQGDASATPLQMTAMIAAVANGGRYYYPRIVRRVVHPEKGVLADDVPRLKVDLLKEGIDSEDLEKIRKGMWMAVNQPGGTCGRARLDDEEIEVAGKTGTAQTVDMGKKSHNAWTVAFAPYDAPKYAVAVVVQNGKSGGKVAGVLVHLILRGLFAADEGMRMPLRPIDEFPGHLDPIPEIPLPEDALAALQIGDAGETGDEAAEAAPDLPPPAEPDEASPAPPTPTITPEIDAGGTVIPRAIPVDDNQQ